jgi:PAS domain S-box-containing protein
MTGRYVTSKWWGRGLAAAYFAALCLLALVVPFVWNSFDDLQRAADNERRLDELASTISRLENTVRMAAQLAVATGERAWFERHSSDARKLTAALLDAKTLLPPQQTGRSIGAAESANRLLTAQEARAFVLAREGKRTLADALLHEPTYVDARTAFHNGTATFLRLGDAQLDGPRAEVGDRLRSFLSTIIATLLVLLGAFAAVALAMRRQAHAIAAVNRQLEAHVKERTASLEAERQRFRDFAETTSDWFWESNADLNITAVSDNFAEATGVAKTDFVGLSLLQLEPSDQHGRLAAEWRPNLTRGQDIRDMYVMIRSPTRGLVYLRFAARAVHGGGTEFMGYRGTAADITEGLVRARAFSQGQKLQALGTMAAGLAHEFNNILAIVIGYAGSLRNVLRNDAEALGEIEQIIDAGRRGASLSKSLLSFGRQSRAGVRETFNARSLTSDLPQLLKPLLGPGCSLSIEAADVALWISVDRDLLLQSVVNLVVNARDAMPDGGTVHVTLELEPAASARVRRAGLKAQGGYVAISVADTGIGMSRETLRRIFDPFFTTKKVGQGTGLGLSLLFGFVKEHQGHVDVESKSNVGTTFTILLPKAAAPQARELAREDEAADIKGLRVLLVDDEPQLLVLYEKMLRELGIEAVARSDLTAALSLLDDEQERFDLIISDVLMPQMIGFRFVELAQGLRENIPALFITGQPERTSDEPTAAPKGAIVLRKPFDREQLSKAIGESLAAADAHATSAVA